MEFTFSTSTAIQTHVEPYSSTDTIDYASLTAGQGLKNTTAAKGDSITVICAIPGHWTVLWPHGTWAQG